MRLILGSAESVHPYHLKWVDETWTKIDKYVGGDDVVKMDARNLEYNNCSIEAIYASHLLEHFSYIEVPKILRHWYDKLQSGGWLHLNVPDLEWACNEVVKNKEYTSSIFNTQEAVINNIFYGTHAHEGEYHKSGYTKEVLNKLLQDAGFADITITTEFEAHDMQVILADCYKP